MTLWTVSNQGFTVHNHTCGINFLSHLRGAPQNSRRSGMTWDAVGDMGRGEGAAVIADIARDRRRKERYHGTTRTIWMEKDRRSEPEPGHEK
jgi:hypothetical protein